jgi:FtsP/CotA-like multicopper oxidase with cupredoxin domain
MGKLVILSSGVVVWTLAAASLASAQSRCSPAPTALENPPEMARVDGQVQSIDLEVRQDGDRLCFVDRGSKDRPGIAPTIRVRPGEVLRVRLFNGIEDVSPLKKLSTPGHPTDFAGVAPEPGYFQIVPGAYHEPTGNTNLHFHGLSVAPTPCGPSVAPGDDVITTYFAPKDMRATSPDSCRTAYEVRIPENQPPGLYWYHTHFHGESEAQTLLGLSGAIVIENEDDDRRRQAGFIDRLLIVRDMPAPEGKPAPSSAGAPQAVEAQGPERAQTVPSPGNARSPLEPLPQCEFGKCIDTVNEIKCTAPGKREQETILTLNAISVRDALNPTGTVPAVSVRAGREEFWRLVNAAANTYLNIHLVEVDESGAAQTAPMSVVALDGAPFTDQSGLSKGEMIAKPVMVPPGGRLEFTFKLDEPASRHHFVLRTEAVYAGCAGDLMPARDLIAIGTNTTATFFGAASEGGQANLPARKARQIADERPEATTPIRRRTFAFTEYQRPHSSKTDFYITEVSRPDVTIEPFPMHLQGGLPNSVVEVQPDTFEEWTILNFTHELHNFHIHQLHFRVLESDDKFLEGRMMDTINTPAALPDVEWSKDDPVTPGKVRLLMRFGRDVSETFVFHCHILSHEDKGMMGLIRVAKPSAVQPAHTGHQLRHVDESVK